MFQQITVVRAYAKAVFAFAFEQQAVEQWQSMLMFSTEVSRNEYMIKLFSSTMTPKKLADIFILICGNQLNSFGQNLIRVMAENRRLALLPDVLKQFIHLREERQSIVEVEVISTISLNKQQLSKIITIMEQRLSHTVKLNCKIDKSVIAGVVIRTGDMVIDGSVRGRLERLANALQF